MCTTSSRVLPSRLIWSRRARGACYCLTVCDLARSNHAQYCLHVPPKGKGQKGQKGQKEQKEQKEQKGQEEEKGQKGHMKQRGQEESGSRFAPIVDCLAAGDQENAVWIAVGGARELHPHIRKARSCGQPPYTKILDLGGFDSSINLNRKVRGGDPRHIGDFPESLSQGILVGIILVGRLGVAPARCTRELRASASRRPVRSPIADPLRRQPIYYYYYHCCY